MGGPAPARPDPYAPPAARGVFRASFAPPGSKSLTNRALLLAGLAGGRSVVRGALTEADDARRMIVALARLGARVEGVPGELIVHGVGGRWPIPKKGMGLELGNAGTATRFLTAAAILAQPGTDGVTIDGDSRMRQRPIGELVELLRGLGAEATYELDEGFPPVTVEPIDDLGSMPGEIVVGPTLSSQFISALLLIAPWLPNGLTIAFDGEVTSASYVRMTLGLLGRVGARVEGAPPGPVRVGPGPLHGLAIDIEPDASGATYFWAAAALVEGAEWATPGLAGSLQADAGFVEVLARMGAATTTAAGSDAGGGALLGIRGSGRLVGIDVDLSDMPDAAMTLGAAACFAEGPTTIRGLRTLRVKETDRVEAMRAELSKVGAAVEVLESPDDLSVRITPPPGGLDVSADAPRVEFDTYDDHRMAMSLALIGLRRPNVWIRDPGCVRKTYPGFWDDLDRLVRRG